MAISHQYFLSSKPYINLDVKYHVYIDVLIYRSTFYFPYIIVCNTIHLSDAVRKLAIYFDIALFQKAGPDCLSISYAYFIVLRNYITNLCDVH